MILAATIGEVNVDAMLARVTPKQFSEWMAFYSMQPWCVGWPAQKQDPETTVSGSMDVARRMAGV